MDKGASADADRAVAASPSSPSVSPLRASIPSAGAVKSLLDRLIWLRGAQDNALGRVTIPTKITMRDLMIARHELTDAADRLALLLPELIVVLEAYVAQAIEARRAETGTGSVHESAVAESDAP